MLYSEGIFEDINKALDDLEGDRNVRVIVITGGGEKSFCAGFDVSDVASVAAVAKGLIRGLTEMPSTSATPPSTLSRHVTMTGKPVFLAVSTSC